MENGGVGGWKLNECKTESCHNTSSGWQLPDIYGCKK
jgi:hypothetical protein